MHPTLARGPELGTGSGVLAEPVQHGESGGLLAGVVVDVELERPWVQARAEQAVDVIEKDPASVQDVRPDLVEGVRCPAVHPDLGEEIPETRGGSWRPVMLAFRAWITGTGLPG